MSDYYGTVEEADAYFSARGMESPKWTSLAEPQKEAKLLIASIWVDNKYRSRYPGQKVGGRAQVRDWPRKNAVDSNGDDIESISTPTEIEHATYEAAYRDSLSPGSLAPDVAGSTKVKRERKKLQSMEKEVEYFDAPSAEAMQPVFTIIEGLLDPVLLPKTGGASVTFLQRV